MKSQQRNRYRSRPSDDWRFMLFSVIVPTTLITLVIAGTIRYTQYPEDASNPLQFLAVMIAFIVISAISIVLGLTFKNSN